MKEVTDVTSSFGSNNTKMVRGGKLGLAPCRLKGVESDQSEESRQGIWR